jgi:hypothetical protein
MLRIRTRSARQLPETTTTATTNLLGLPKWKRCPDAGGRGSAEKLEVVSYPKGSTAKLREVLDLS